MTQPDSQQFDGEPPECDTFSILVATDIHLGYAGRDVFRRNDAMNTFEEILQIALRKRVDFVLLGGDLFHHNKPHTEVLTKCAELIRKYCFNDRPIEFESLSDPEVVFSHGGEFAHPNYEDPNINVGVPIFSIAGNHDDVTGNPPVCALDLFHKTGLINLFGKYTTDVTSVDVVPLLFKKGKTKLALYGMSAIRDERLHHLFLDRKVKFFRPQDSESENNPWFSLFALHQNRAKHGDTNYIPESFLPDFLSLVVWGHEHPCRIDPEWVGGTQDFYITQPGSSVATSLSEGEAGDKYIGHLMVYGNKFRLHNIRLETTRQFYFEQIFMADSGLDAAVGEGEASRQVKEYCKEKVDALLERAAKERRPNQPELPLIRIRVDLSGGYESFNPQRFGVEFQGRVGNPKDLVLFHKTRGPGIDAKLDKDAMAAAGDGASSQGVRVEDLIKDYFAQADPESQMLLLSETGLSEAVLQYVQKDETDAVSTIVLHQLSKTRDYLKNRTELDPTKDAIHTELRDLRKKRAEQNERIVARSVLDQAADKRRQAGGATRPASMSGSDEESIGEESIVDYDLDDGESSRPSTSRGRGSRSRARGAGTSARGRGTRGAKGRGDNSSRRERSERTNTSSSKSRQSTLHDAPGPTSRGRVLRASNRNTASKGAGDGGVAENQFSRMDTSTSIKRKLTVTEDSEDEGDGFRDGPFGSSSGRKKR